MKILLSLLVTGIVCVSASCRVNPPIDPHTMKPSCKCMPGKFVQDYPSTCTHCGTHVTVYTK